MKVRNIMASALLAATPFFLALPATAIAAENDLRYGDTAEAQQVETLHVGPGNGYEILATIRPGTSPRVKFCQYQGRWCYGSYGRWNGWFYGGKNTWDVWSLAYWLGK